MKYWILKSGERVLASQMPTGQILEALAQLQKMRAMEHSPAIKKAVNKAITRFDRILKKRNLL